MSHEFMNMLAATFEGCLRIMIYYKYGLDGYRCKCGCPEYTRIANRPKVLVCHDCHRQESVTSNTVFEGMRLPLEVIVGVLVDYLHGEENASRLARKYKRWSSTILRLLDRIRALLKKKSKKGRFQRVPAEAPQLKSVLVLRSIESSAKIVPKVLASVQAKLLNKLKKNEGKARAWYAKLNPLNKGPVVDFSRYCQRVYRCVSKRKGENYTAEFNFRQGHLGTVDEIMTECMRSKPIRSSQRSSKYVLLPFPSL